MGHEGPSACPPPRIYHSSTGRRSEWLRTGADRRRGLTEPPRPRMQPRTPQQARDRKARARAPAMQCTRWPLAALYVVGRPRCSRTTRHGESQRGPLCNHPCRNAQTTWVPISRLLSCQFPLGQFEDLISSGTGGRLLMGSSSAAQGHKGNYGPAQVKDKPRRKDHLPRYGPNHGSSPELLNPPDRGRVDEKL